MNPLYNIEIPSIPLVVEEQHQSCIPFLSLGTSSSIPFDNQQDQTANNTYNLLHHHPYPQEEIGLEPCYFRNHLADQSSCYQNEKHHGDRQGSVKWMSSKMRIMRKMMNSDEHRRLRKPRRTYQQAMEDQKQDGSSGIVRVCSDCNTTKTPLWRSGPRGPKSLCNACGIRQRKARRAMAVAAAAVAASGETPGKRKDNASDVDLTVPFKKRCRLAATDQSAHKKLCFEDMIISLNKSSSFQHVFPQDEKDAAILLMALSCGLICS